MKPIIVLVFSFVCYLLFSCSNGELSKDQAKQQILQKIKFPYSDSREYFIMHTLPEPYISAGLVELHNCACENWKNSCPELTEKGKEYFIKTISQPPCDDYITVRTADVNFGEIIKIWKLNEGKSAEVFYTIQKKITPFGKLLNVGNAKDTLLERRAIFFKTAGKWIIDKAQLQSHPL